MLYRHKIVQGLADLIKQYGSSSSDPMLRAVWWGLKGQIPSLLQSLDSNEGMVIEMEEKVKEALGVTDTAYIKDELLSLFQRRNKDGSITIRIPASNKLATLFPVEEPSGD